MLDDTGYMELAFSQARFAAEKGEVPVGAVLVDAGGRILAEERNMPIELCDPCAHAEILALKQGAKRMGNYRLTGTTLYVTLEPCPMCAGALVLARVQRLVFATPDPKSGACGSVYNIVQDPRLNHRLEVEQGVLEEACRGLIQHFFRARRQI
jgi:tRNA(adenine34) deaminase